jgi:hypothetical protein
MHSGPHQLTPEGPRPPVATSPRTHGPLIPDREALCASAHSLCRLPIYLISIASYLLYTRTDMASKEVARKVRILSGQHVSFKITMLRLV